MTPPASFRVRALIVQLRTTQEHTTKLWEVVSAAHEPPHALRTDVHDVGLLASSVAPGLDQRRGERCQDSWVIAAPEALASSGEPARGGSDALPRVLCSLQAHWGIALRANVYATGGVDPKTGDVTRIDHLATKLRDALARCERPAIILYPACQEDEARALVSKVGAPAPEVQLRGVATIQEAANVVFNVPEGEAFDETQIGRLRSTVHRMRMDRARVRELFDSARALYEEAQRYPVGRLRLTSEFHAMNAAAFALETGQLESGWPGTSLRGAALLSLLRGEIARRAEAERGAIEPELLAEHHNLRAAEGLRTLELTAAIDHATRGLAIPRLLAGPDGERRKLLGTRAQLRWKRALRYVGSDDEGEARSDVDAALADIDEALAIARHGGVEDQNDRARVRVYCASALLAKQVVSGLARREEAEMLANLHEALGGFFDGTEDRPPQQDPTWALHVMYAWLATTGQKARMLGHFREVRAFASATMRGEHAVAPTLQTRLLDARDPLPACARILDLLLDAAIETGDEEIARLAAGRLALDARPAVRRYAWLSRSYDAPAGWRLLSPAALDAWRETGAHPQTSNKKVARMLADLHRALIRADVEATRAARRALVLWHGDIPVSS